MLFRCRPNKSRCVLITVTLCIAIFCLSQFPNRSVFKEIESFALFYVNAVEPVNTMRQNLTIFSNLSTDLITRETNVTAAEEIFHRYASEIQVKCPASKRLGNAADGGWDVCVYASYNFKKPCLVYSFGINNEWSFDDSVVSTFNCTVRAFDPSMQASDHRRGPNIWFYKQGISGSDSVNSRGWKLKTLNSFTKMLNESDEVIDYLKIDVEYSEWASLEAILNSTLLTRVKQFGLETHTREISKNPSTVADFVYYSEILRRLQDAGFYRWYWHYNKYGVFVSKNSQRKLTCCYEMVFINVNIPYS